MSKLDLDLIRRVQQARRQHDQDAIPSQHSGAYWIEARAETSPVPTARAGYWWFSTTVDQVDALWARIKAATEAGHLGYKARVATTSRDAHSDHRVIHIMTCDSRDAADVARVRAALEGMNLPGGLQYHADED